MKFKMKPFENAIPLSIQVSPFQTYSDNTRILEEKQLANYTLNF